ncbi:MAG: enoyl-ACP reductase [Ilumatobacteraceae bacterium]|nr:enoyl-ACP reductase [Ilumatobacteraceae bacterium]
MTTMPSLLAGKKLLITGVVNTESIAFATAAAALDAGADIVLSSLGRDLDATALAADVLRGDVEVVEADLTDAEHLHHLTDHLLGRWGHIDGALHAVAFAPREALAGDFLAARSDAISRAFQTSAITYASLASVVAQLAPPQGASLVGLDFDAAGAWPVYNWMGVCKAALESVNRYLARDLGGRRIRANLIAAGPLHTRAAGGIPEFELLTGAWERQSPLPWDPKDSAPVAETACFLLSDLSRMISGEILHVDGGYHAMAAPLREPGELTPSREETP